MIPGCRVPHVSLLRHGNVNRPGVHLHRPGAPCLASETWVCKTPGCPIFTAASSRWAFAKRNALLIDAQPLLYPSIALPSPRHPVINRTEEDLPRHPLTQPCLRCLRRLVNLLKRLHRIQHRLHLPGIHHRLQHRIQIEVPHLTSALQHPRTFPIR